MLILDLWDISFHAVVAFGLGENLLFKSVLGRCDYVDKMNMQYCQLGFEVSNLRV